MGAVSATYIRLTQARRSARGRRSEPRGSPLMAYVIDPPTQPFLTITAATIASPSTASTVSDATTPSTRARWAEIPRSRPRSLPEEPRQRRSRRQVSLPVRDQGRALGDRARGGAEGRRIEHRPQGGAEPRVWLRGRNRYDAARSSVGGQKLGRPWEYAKAFEKSAPCSPLVPGTRSDTRPRARFARGQRGTPSVGRHLGDDLGRAAHHRLPVQTLGPATGRRHHDRHAGGRRRHQEGRPPEGASGRRCTLEVTVV